MAVACSSTCRRVDRPMHKDDQLTGFRGVSDSVQHVGNANFPRWNPFTYFYSECQKKVSSAQVWGKYIYDVTSILLILGEDTWKILYIIEVKQRVKIQTPDVYLVPHCVDNLLIFTIVYLWYYYHLLMALLSFMFKLQSFVNHFSDVTQLPAAGSQALMSTLSPFTQPADSWLFNQTDHKHISPELTQNSFKRLFSSVRSTDHHHPKISEWLYRHRGRQSSSLGTNTKSLQTAALLRLSCPPPQHFLLLSMCDCGQCEHTPSSLYGSFFHASLIFIMHLKASLVILWKLLCKLTLHSSIVKKKT